MPPPHRVRDGADATASLLLIALLGLAPIAAIAAFIIWAILLAAPPGFESRATAIALAIAALLLAATIAAAERLGGRTTIPVRRAAIVLGLASIWPAIPFAAAHLLLAPAEALAPILITLAAMIVFIAAAAAILAITRRHLRRARAGRCLLCAYPLANLPPGSPCPECGPQRTNPSQHPIPLGHPTTPRVYSDQPRA